MKQSYEVKLWVNSAPVDLNPFVEDFLARTLAGAVSSLKGVEVITELELSVQEGDVSILVNGNDIPLTPFPNDAIASIVTGIVSRLRDVGSSVGRVRVHMEAR
ncbi:MAG: hypothetical protein DRI39_02205 [Chloroflexi bacterium]|nr:MAG: hypothetical protein DRI39_02205 [Chloroflexota bacterium]